MSDKIWPLACLFVFWKAHKKLIEHREQEKEDTLEDDPLHYTTIKTYCAVPITVWLASMALKLSGKDESARRFWEMLVKTKTPYWFYKYAYLAGISFYMGTGLACLALDLIKKPSWLYKYKIQPDAVIDYHSALPKLFATLLANIGSPIIFAMLPGTGRMKKLVTQFVGRYIKISPEIPSVWEVTKAYWTFLFIYDIFFHYSHWALHTKYLYAWIHKKHHEWKSPTALAAAYSHPIEHLLSNLMPGVGTILVSKPHFLAFFINTMFGLSITLFEHSGYEFVDTAAYHNIHHRTFRSNYGVSGVYDYIHDTRAFQQNRLSIAGEKEQADPIESN